MLPDYYKVAELLLIRVLGPLTINIMLEAF